MSSHHVEAERLAHQITDYLEVHPDAADTIEGVIQWWLPPLAAGVSVATVQRALDELVSRGRIVRRVLVDGAVIFARR